MSSLHQPATPGPGFRIGSRPEVPPPAGWEELGEHPTPDLCDLLHGLQGVDPALGCLTGESPRLCGPALTVRVRPGDNLMVAKALDLARPGDVLVVDARGSLGAAVAGDLLCTRARRRGLAGLVVDGAVRDLPGILPLGLPVFARGVTTVAPRKHGPGEILYPVVCGGLVVHPGDLVVGDEAGLVVVPREAVPDLLPRLRAFRVHQAERERAAREGPLSSSRVEAVLREAGVLPG